MEQNIFENLKRINQFWQEYWSVREFYKTLEYTEYGKFLPAVNRAKKSCTSSWESIKEHFAHGSEPQKSRNQYGETDWQILEDIHLSRFACYLIVQNADSRKESVALGQKYFALQTRKQELNDLAIEDSKWKDLRDEMTKHNITLAKTADKAGVRVYGVFTNYWYMWLYNGLDAKWIHAKKWLKTSQKILDHMGSEELAANLFRTTQAEAKLNREGINGANKANDAHFEVGREVRETIKKLWGTMPEELAVSESITKVEKRLESWNQSKITEQSRSDKLIEKKDVKDCKFKNK